MGIKENFIQEHKNFFKSYDTVFFQYINNSFKDIIINDTGEKYLLHQNQLYQGELLSACRKTQNFEESCNTKYTK